MLRSREKLPRLSPIGAAGATLCLLAAGCTASGEPPCLLGSQSRAVSITLFFGRDIPGRAKLQEAEWAGFVATDLAPRFPAGFTVSDGTGAWRDPASGVSSTEATKIVDIVAPPGDGLAERVAALAAAYRRQFHQQSVGITSAPVCGAF